MPLPAPAFFVKLFREFDLFPNNISPSWAKFNEKHEEEDSNERNLRKKAQKLFNLFLFRCMYFLF